MEKRVWDRYHIRGKEAIDLSWKPALFVALYNISWIQDQIFLCRILNFKNWKKFCNTILKAIMELTRKEDLSTLKGLEKLIPPSLCVSPPLTDI